MTAVQVFNNPQVEFKSELFIVTTVIAWTYLLHAYYRKLGIDYRQLDSRHKGKRRKYLTEYDDSRFSYRVAFVQKVTNSKSAADQLFQLIPPGTEVSEAMNKAFLKETEKIKYRPKTIVAQMQAEGFVKFSLHKHTLMWQEKDAKNPKHQYGTQVEAQWYWYKPWLKQVREHCQKEEPLYKPMVIVPGTTKQKKAG